jgi:hypothetical protein
MRKMAPFVFVALLAVGSIVGALLGIVNSPTILYFSTPPDSPQAAHALRGYVAATLNDQSFVVRQGNQTTVYQAPDRDLLKIGHTVLELQIGFRTYFPYPTVDGHTQRWLEEVVPKEFDVSFASPVRHNLQNLLNSPSIQRRGDEFIVQRVASADSISPGSLGQALYTKIVRVRAGHVVSVTSKVQGKFNRLLPPPKCHNCTTIGFSFPMVATYSGFGRHLTVTAPPKKDVARLICHRGGSSKQPTFDCHPPAGGPFPSSAN